MKIEQVKLTQVRTNSENPRQIGKVKFQKLIDSLLVFPAMMEIRPIVVDGVMAAIGGNQRLAALRAISKMEVEEMAQRIFRSPEYQERTDAEKKRLVDFWGEWQQKPTVYIINAKTLTAAERRQFIIKDNVSYGQWDYDALANKWDNDRLEAMGLDVWTSKPTELTPLPGEGTASNTPGDWNGDDGDPAQTDPLAGIEGALPPELQGRDMTPDHLDNIKGEDATPSDHIIITYTPEEKQALAGYLGIDADTLFSKICWRLDELQEQINQDIDCAACVRDEHGTVKIYEPQEGHSDEND
ncbi:MAG: hypothetical protein HFJ95_01490 [Muribaculaceae bacterium]|nr:hypothetical protein [Muribaculaceae bacterium]